MSILNLPAARACAFWRSIAAAKPASASKGSARIFGEALQGIHKVWEHRKDADLPQPLRDLVAQIQVCNTGDELRWYPGSPQLAAQMVRPGDHLRMYELHPTESKLLAKHFADVKRGVSIEVADGFSHLKTTLPPPPKREKP